MNEEFPFQEDINYVIDEIQGFDFSILDEFGKRITENLKIRDEKEKSFRVTSIIDYDYFNSKSLLKINKNYMKTYLHDRLLDVSCEFFNGFYDNIFNCYKEKFIFSTFDGKKIKGHADIILNNDTLGEIKNYTGGKIDKYTFLKFIHQIMIYCLFLRLNKAILIINNPQRYKGITVISIKLNKQTELYIKNFLNVTLSIPDIKKSFKYK